MREITAGPRLTTGASPVVRTHRYQTNRGEERSLKSITKFTYFAVVLTAPWSE